MKRQFKKPVHPGEILQKEFLTKLECSQERFAHHIGVTTTTINSIVRGRSGITPKMARKFAAAFGTTAEFWLKLQHETDLWELEQIEDPLPKLLPHKNAA